MRREPGTGTIEERVNRDGSVSYRARVTLTDGRASSPWLPTPESAKAFGDKLRETGRRGEVRSRQGLTLRDWWATVVDELHALRKPRSARYDAAWRQFVQHSDLADLPLDRIDRNACREFVYALLRAKVASGSRTIATGTARTTTAALSAVLSEAMHRELIPTNPLHRLRIDWPDDSDDAIEYWEPAEIDRMLTNECVPEADRIVIQFYLGAGLRAGEGVWMPLADLERAVVKGELFVRYGSRGRAPKGNKTRTIPLLPLARDAAERWLAILPKFAPKNPQGLAFPREDGSTRETTEIVGVDWRGGERVTWFDRHQAAAKVHRIVWHGLRHTCGAALASGWWGRVWALHEIRDLLGHSTIRVTEKHYGHLAPSALRRAAELTSGGVPRRPEGDASARNQGANEGSGSRTVTPVVSSAWGDFSGLGTLTGLRAALDARLATGWRPTPDECEAIARAVLALEPIAVAASAVLDAAPEHRARRLIALLELLPNARPTRRAEEG